MHRPRRPAGWSDCPRRAGRHGPGGHGMVTALVPNAAGGSRPAAGGMAADASGHRLTSPAGRGFLRRSSRQAIHRPTASLFGATRAADPCLLLESVGAGGIDTHGGSGGEVSGGDAVAADLVCGRTLGGSGHGAADHCQRCRHPRERAGVPPVATRRGSRKSCGHRPALVSDHHLQRACRRRALPARSQSPLHHQADIHQQQFAVCGNTRPWPVPVPDNHSLLPRGPVDHPPTLRRRASSSIRAATVFAS